MLWLGIKKLGKELQLKRIDSEIVGMVKNCFVKLYDGKGMKFLELFVPEISDSDKEYIGDKLKINKIKKYEWLEYGVKIIFIENLLPYSMSKIKNILTDFTEYFSANYPDQSPRCQKCGIPKDLDAYCVGTTTFIICEDCYKSLEKETKEKNLENKSVPSNYLLGFIGFLLYSMPSVLVTVSMFVFLNTLVAVSSVIYVILGIKGYKKFKGKISRIGSIIIILSTIIMVGFGIIVAYSVFILRELKTTDIELLINILRIREIQQEIVKNIILSYVISGFYLVYQVIQMMKEWKTEKSIKKSRDI